MQTEKSSATDE